MNTDRYQKARVLLRDDAIYVFEIVREPHSADLVGPCRARLAHSDPAEKIGTEVRGALLAYGREVSREDIRAMGEPFARATGYSDSFELNRGLGSVGVVYDVEDGEYIYELQAWRTKGPNSFPMKETTTQLPRNASTLDLGKEVLRLLEVSEQQNTRLKKSRKAVRNPGV